MTGGTGFLGSHVLPLLEGHDVLCASRDPDRVPRLPGVRTLHADLGRGGDWADEIRRFRPDWCLHLAWEGLPDYSLARCRANLDSSIRLLHVVTEAAVKRVVVAGSCGEYGRTTGVASESALPIDVGVFAAAKLALLTMLDSVARQAPFEYRWARVFFVYGPGQRPTSLIPHLRARTVAGCAPEVREPGTLQDFVHVEDVAAGLVALAACEAHSGIFNLGTGEPTSVAHVANRVARHYGRTPPFESVPAGAGFWADTTKMYTETGWRARISADEGIDKTLAKLDASE